MERKSCSESNPLTPGIETSRPKHPIFRLTLVITLMLWPWLCVGFGLYFIQDYRVTMLMYGALCCALPIILFRRRRIRIWPLNMNWARLLSLSVGLSLIVWGVFQGTSFGINRNTFIPLAEQIHLLANRQLIEYGLYFIIVNPLLEEVFWRSFIYNEWKRFVSTRTARIISSICFGAWHWVIVQHFCPPVWAIFLASAVALGGYFFARAYDETKTLAAPIIMHAIGADLPLFLIVLSLLQGH